jgi:anti-sigma B factor antagonist
MASEDMKIQKETIAQGSIVMLILNGAINVNTFDKLETEIQQLFMAGSYKLILDVSGIRYVSSAGAGVLMNAFLQAQENNGKMVLIRVSNSVKDVLELLNLQNVIPIADDLKSALPMFG